jgi:hypothetical protein
MTTKIRQHTKVHSIYEIGDKIEVLKSIENDKQTKNKYPYFAINFKKH